MSGHDSVKSVEVLKELGKGSKVCLNITIKKSSFGLIAFVEKNNKSTITFALERNDSYLRIFAHNYTNFFLNCRHKIKSKYKDLTIKQKKIILHPCVSVVDDNHNNVLASLNEIDVTVRIFKRKIQKKKIHRDKIQRFSFINKP